MNIQNTLGITLGTLVLLGTFSIANADTGVRINGASFLGLGNTFSHKERDDERDMKHGKSAISGEVTAKTETSLTVKNKDGDVYTVNTTNAEVKHGSLADISIGDRIRAWGKVDGAAVQASHIFELSLKKMKDAKEKVGKVAAGVVTSMNGTVFTIDAFKRNATTTVTTDANTAFKINGQATTSAALGVGSKVVLFGTTTATSTSGDAFSASVVHIMTKGLGYMKYWFWLR